MHILGWLRQVDYRPFLWNSPPPLSMFYLTTIIFSFSVVSSNVVQNCFGGDSKVIRRWFEKGSLSIATLMPVFGFFSATSLLSLRYFRATFLLPHGSLSAISPHPHCILPVSTLLFRRSEYAFYQFIFHLNQLPLLTRRNHFHIAHQNHFRCKGTENI